MMIVDLGDLLTAAYGLDHSHWKPCTVHEQYSSFSGMRWMIETPFFRILLPRAPSFPCSCPLLMAYWRFLKQVSWSFQSLVYSLFSLSLWAVTSFPAIHKFLSGTAKNGGRACLAFFDCFNYWVLFLQLIFFRIPGMVTIRLHDILFHLIFILTHVPLRRCGAYLVSMSFFCIFIL